MDLNIHYMTPYSVGGNIGQAYNRACSLIADPEDWIVIRDGDTMFLTPEWGRVIAEVLQRHGDDFMLLGAMTNRLAENHQRMEGMFDEMDLRVHYELAKLMEGEATRTEVFQTLFDIAGMLMVFKKGTWDRVGGFEENSPVFDRIFTRRVQQAGGKVGVMKGLYVLHAYRLWSKDPANDARHIGG